MAYWVKSDLKNKRNWTDGFIRDFLGEPDATRPNPRGKYPMKLYLQERVLTAEGTKEFIAKMETRSEVQARRERVSDASAAFVKREISMMVAGLKVGPFAPEWGDLVTQACSDFNERVRYPHHPLITAGSPPEALERVCVDYLWLNLVKDCNITPLEKAVGKWPAYKRLSQRVHAIITSTYPRLAAECKRQESRPGNPRDQHERCISCGYCQWCGMEWCRGDCPAGRFEYPKYDESVGADEILGALDSSTFASMCSQCSVVSLSDPDAWMGLDFDERFRRRNLDLESFARRMRLARIKCDLLMWRALSSLDAGENIKPREAATLSALFTQGLIQVSLTAKAHQALKDRECRQSAEFMLLRRPCDR